ncbi:unnamed protein product [Acanthosepion pharaonis]|uniref:Transposase n=1 Tax=Acanthosepion pharaonis TaxID=158019 RepID=A0A812ESG5_ACAPH|nr:unnamed protein product [Sepia pharaonis]
MEYDRRAAVEASIRAGKKPAEVMAWTDEFVAAGKEIVDNERRQSYAKITADMRCHKSMISRTIKKDIGYSSYRRSQRMLITNAFKEGQGGGFAERSKARVRRDADIISSVGDVMPPFFFQKGLRATAEIHQEELRSVVKPWMDEIAVGRPYVFQQNSAPTPKAKTTQAWLINVSHHWSPDCGRPPHRTATPLSISSGE